LTVIGGKMIQCQTTKEAPGFSCTGSDESEIWGQLHDSEGNIGPLVEKFHCGTCQEHGHRLFLGVHSLVSLGIGKKLTKERYKKAFLDLKSDVENVFNSARADNRI